MGRDDGGEARRVPGGVGPGRWVPGAALTVVALAAVACADGNPRPGIADGVPEEVLQAQERLEAGVPRAAVAHFFAADGSLGAIRSEGSERAGAPPSATPWQGEDSAQLAEWLHAYSLSELWEKNVLGGWP